MVNTKIVLLAETENVINEIELFYKNNNEIEINKSLEVFDTNSFIRFCSLDLVILNDHYASEKVKTENKLNNGQINNVIVIQILNDDTILNLVNSSKLPKYYLNEKLLCEELLTNAIFSAVEDSIQVN